MPIALTPRDIGSVIREKRQKLGLGQHALADRVGVSRQWIVEIEQGKPRAEIGLLLRTMAVLGLTIMIGPYDGSGRRPSTSKISRDHRADEYHLDIDAIVDRARGSTR